MKSFKQYITEAAGIGHMIDAEWEVLDRLMDEDVLVTIKVDSAALVVLNDRGTLRFFNRGAQKEITMIERSAMNVFEEVITHIEKRDWKKLPSGVMFFLEYFNDQLKPLITYSSRPKNNMILLYGKKGGSILRADDPILTKAATILDVAAPPIIHQGKLNSKQKELLRTFVRTDADERKQKFGLDNFRDMILKMFGVNPSHNWLVKDGLEGVVIIFGKDKNPTQFKVVDPAFTSRIKAKQVDNKKVEDYRRLVNNVFWDFVTDDMIDKTLASVKTKGNPGFIEFVSKLVTQIPGSQALKLKAYKDTAEGSRMFGFTPGITPMDIIRMSKNNFYVEDMYRQVLYMLRAPKNRANPKQGLTPALKDRVNGVIAKLQERGLL